MKGGILSRGDGARSKGDSRPLAHSKFTSLLDGQSPPTPNTSNSTCAANRRRKAEADSRSDVESAEPRPSGGG